MGAGAASKKSVNVGGGGGALRLAAVINDANGCFASEVDFSLALAGTGTNNCIGVIMAAGGGGGRGGHGGSMVMGPGARAWRARKGSGAKAGAVDQTSSRGGGGGGTWRARPAKRRSAFAEQGSQPPQR